MKHIIIETDHGTIDGERAVTNMLGVLADARHEAGKIDHDAGHNGWEGLAINDRWLIDSQIRNLKEWIDELVSYERVFKWLDEMYDEKLCRKNLARARKVLSILRARKKQDVLDRKNEKVAEDWFRNEVGWYMSSGDDDYPHKGSTTSKRYEDGTMRRRFRGGHSHEEGGESIEIVIRRHEGGTWDLERSTHAVDCDGPLDRYWSAVVADGKITDEDSRQRDHYAEAMGY